MEPKQKQLNYYFTRFYIFLRDRDAKIIELFFLALNSYILALVLLPPYTYTGLQFAWRAATQIFVTVINLLALIVPRKHIRIASAIANVAIMALISTTLWSMGSPHAGTYSLICLQAAFVCWKINIRQ